MSSAQPIDDLNQELDHLRAQGKPNAVTRLQTVTREFGRRGDDRYVFSILEVGIELEIDRLRRDRHELIGELAVRCILPGARTIAESGTISIADLNVSSARARTDRAKLLTDRSNTRGLDWAGLIEDFCQRLLAAERAGMPAIDLRSLPAPGAEEVYSISGITMPQKHPSILFGDGAVGKSYIALFVGGKLVENGTRVALFDWELAAENHRERLERLFPDGMPRLVYARCEKPLVHEVDRLRRIVRENGIEFSIYDSVAFAADGPPEAAEVAGRYFRAVRQIGGGSLHVAHVSKAEGADKKPFGSTFWHNGARATWNVQLAESTAGTDILNLGLFNRKSNLSKLSAPIGLTIEFRDGRTVIRRCEVASSPDLAPNLSVRQRMAFVLKHGPMSADRIAEEIDADVETVRRTQRRYRNQFIVLEGGKVGLQQ
jgi:hypothetical protein